MKRLCIASAVTLALLLAACDESPKVDKAAIEKSIRDSEIAWAKEMPDKNVTKMVGHYTSDAVVMGSGMAAAKGPAAIRSLFSDMFSDPNLAVQFATDKVEVADAGDMAVTRGTYNMTMSDPATKKPINDKGSYVTVYHKQTDGSWKASLDILASDVPPPPPPAPKAGKKAAAKSAAKKKRR